MVYLSHPGNNCNCYGDQEQKLKNKSSRVSVVPKDTKAKQVISRREKEKNGSEMQKNEERSSKVYNSALFQN